MPTATCGDSTHNKRMRWVAPACFFLASLDLFLDGVFDPWFLEGDNPSWSVCSISILQRFRIRSLTRLQRVDERLTFLPQFGHHEASSYTL